MLWGVEQVQWTLWSLPIQEHSPDTPPHGLIGQKIVERRGHSIENKNFTEFPPNFQIWRMEGPHLLRH